MWILQFYVEGGIKSQWYVEGGRDLGGREEGEGRRVESGVGRDGGDRCTEVQKTEWRCVAVGDGELGVATRKFQMPGKQEAPRIQGG